LSYSNKATKNLKKPTIAFSKIIGANRPQIAATKCSLDIMPTTPHNATGISKYEHHPNSAVLSLRKENEYV